MGELLALPALGLEHDDDAMMLKETLPQRRRWPRRLSQQLEEVPCPPLSSSSDKLYVFQFTEME